MEYKHVLYFVNDVFLLYYFYFQVYNKNYYPLYNLHIYQGFNLLMDAH